MATLRHSRERSLPARAGSGPHRAGEAAGPGTAGVSQGGIEPGRDREKVGSARGRGQAATASSRWALPRPPALTLPRVLHQRPARIPPAPRPRPRAAIGCRPLSSSQSRGSCQALPSIFSTHKQTLSAVGVCSVSGTRSERGHGAVEAPARAKVRESSAVTPLPCTFALD